MMINFFVSQLTNNNNSQQQYENHHIFNSNNIQTNLSFFQFSNHTIIVVVNKTTTKEQHKIINPLSFCLTLHFIKHKKRVHINYQLLEPFSRSIVHTYIVCFQQNKKKTNKYNQSK